MFSFWNVFFRKHYFPFLILFGMKRISHKNKNPNEKHLFVYQCEGYSLDHEKGQIYKMHKLKFHHRRKKKQITAAPRWLNCLLEYFHDCNLLCNSWWKFYFRQKIFSLVIFHFPIFSFTVNWSLKVNVIVNQVRPHR